MPDVVIEQQPTIDLLADNSPALSTSSDIPKVETKPDSQPAPKVEVKPEAKVDAAPDEGKKPVESAPAEQPDDEPSAIDEAEGKPKAKGVQKKLDELTRNWREAERREEAERAEKLRLLALVERGPRPEKPVVEEDTGPQKPSREAFADPNAYEAALMDYATNRAEWAAGRAVEKALAAKEQQDHQRLIEEGQKSARQAYQDRVTKTQEKYTDYREVAESPNVQVTAAMAQAILNHDQGPEIQYFLGKNPAEAQRISSLNPVAQLVELGLIVGKLTSPKEEKPTPAKPAVSSAPKPVKPLEPKPDSARKTPDEETMEEYGARREKELRAERQGARR